MCSPRLPARRPARANVDRLLRLPGTINHPNKKKITEGRTVCQAHIVSLTDARYPLGLFSEVVPSSTPAAAETKCNGAAGPAETHAAAKIELN